MVTGSVDLQQAQVLVFRCKTWTLVQAGCVSAALSCTLLDLGRFTMQQLQPIIPNRAHLLHTSVSPQFSESAIWKYKQPNRPLSEWNNRFKMFPHQTSNTEINSMFTELRAAQNSEEKTDAKTGQNNAKEVTFCSRSVSRVLRGLNLILSWHPHPQCAQTVCAGPHPSRLCPFTPLRKTLLSFPLRTWLPPLPLSVNPKTQRTQLFSPPSPYIPHWTMHHNPHNPTLPSSQTEISPGPSKQSLGAWKHGRPPASFQSQRKDVPAVSLTQTCAPYLTCHEDLWEAGSTAPEDPTYCCPGPSAVRTPSTLWSGGCHHLPDTQGPHWPEETGPSESCSLTHPVPFNAALWGKSFQQSKCTLTLHPGLRTTSLTSHSMSGWMVSYKGLTGFWILSEIKDPLLQKNLR